MIFGKNLFNIILPSIYMSLRNKNLEDIKKYYNMQSINNKDRFNRFNRFNRINRINRFYSINLD